MTPHRWSTLARVVRARELLETGEASVDRVARRCGLGSPAGLRTHLRRELDTTPTAYRRAFGHAAGGPGGVTTGPVRPQGPERSTEEIP